MPARPRILFVDDESAQRELLAGFFSKRGHDTAQAGSGVEALGIFQANPAPIVCVDMKMPGMSGIELIGKLLEMRPSTQIIVLTAFGTIETAVAAIKAGAFHYQTKPVELEELKVNIDKAHAQYLLAQDSTRDKAALAESTARIEILGASPPIQNVRSLIERVAPTESSVLITGPSGAGKELVARSIHAQSKRSHGRFVALNCGAFPETLLEAELFGYEKGAFTGAERSKIGRFELADSGSLFLDEIGEAPLSLQVKLLRVLESGEFEKLGSEITTSVDFRLIAATNRDLTEAMKSGAFREDLYYRLNVVTIDVPPLKERVGDVPLLANAFLQRFARRAGRGEMNISSDALKLLESYQWPGNIRELQNLIERAVTLSQSETLTPELFAGIGADSGANESELLADVEKAHIQRALQRYGWNVSLTAEQLGIHRNTLTQKIKEYSLVRPE